MDDDSLWADIERSHRRGKVMGGFLIVMIGSLFLARELGAEIPYWVFTWKMLLVGLGLLLAVKHKLKHPGWIILIAIGGSFLVNDIYPELNIRPFLWPSLLIIAGLFIMFRPRRREGVRFRRFRRRMRHHHAFSHRDVCYNREEQTEEDVIDSTVFMAGVKKTILSKQFRGGEITNVFGGTELNLSGADFENTVSLEITQVFAGTKLIVPANWEIRSELVTIFGSVEDKRQARQRATGEPVKTLVLTGTTFFGGIDIRSF